jgi:hypothetical protein
LQFVPKQQKLSPQQRQLLSSFDQLDTQDRETLLAFAEFLQARQSPAQEVEGQPAAALEPRAIDRPQKESVVKAIKRLSETYCMLQRDQLLDQTSSLMMSHVMQGREADSVIDELEIVYSEHYERYQQQRKEDI